jgi:hypothetical protein
MEEQSFRRRWPTAGMQAMAGQANDKIPMSNKIQNPNVKMSSDIVSLI